MSKRLGGITGCKYETCPRREKQSHRPPRTIVDALSKFGLHRCLLRCGRECKGVRDVGPKSGTYMFDKDSIDLHRKTHA